MESSRAAKGQGEGRGGMRRVMVGIVLACLSLAVFAADGKGDRTEPFPSRLLGRSIQIALHVPQLPPVQEGRLVLVLPGAFDGPGDFIDQGIFRELGRMEREGRIRPALWVAVAHHRSWYADRKDGTFPFERFLIEELMPDLERRFPAYGGQPGRRSVAGLSMGGFGALNLAGRTALFSRCLALSPALVTPPFKNAGWLLGMSLRRTFAEDPVAFAPWNPWEHLGGKCELRMVCGLQDKYGLAQACRDFQARCQRQGRPMGLELSEGGHAWSYWTPEFLRLAAWLNGN